MERREKLLLLIASICFILPELLWSPLLSFWYRLWNNTDFPLRPNAFTASHHALWDVGVLALQLFGLILFWFALLLTRKKVKILYFILLEIFITFLAVVNFLALALSLSLRHIGF